MTLYSAYTIKHIINLLTTYSKSVSTKSDIVKVKNRYISDLKLMTIMLKELQNTVRPTYSLPVDYREMSNMINEFNNMISKIKKLEDGQQTEVIGITSKLEIYKDYRFADIDDYNTEQWVDDLADNYYKENMELPFVRDMGTIVENININRPFNIFSPKCGQGLLLNKFKEYGECTTYGLESITNAHRQAKNNLDRVIRGEMQGSKISNDCFDIMQLTPPVSWMAELGATGNLLEKKEKHWLRNTIKYLRKDGILIFTIPVTRVTNDMAFVFSKLLSDVQVLKANSDVTLNYVHIIGKKNISKDSRKDVYAYLSNLNTMAELPTELDFKYELASGGIITPELFRGSVLDEEELEQIINTSGLMSSFWKQHEIEQNESNIRPLLPFNMGQIGLVLTSGCLDGVVEEYEGQYHAIKGMVTKVRDFNNSREDNDETSIETISNKVQINLLTPDGQFIELA